MKTLKCVWMVGSVAFFLATGCSNSDTVNKEKVDKLGKKFDSAAEKLWDSTKEKGKELGKEIKGKMDSVKLK